MLDVLTLTVACGVCMCCSASLQRFSPELHSFLRSCLVKDAAQRPSAADLLTHPFIVNNKSTQSLLLAMVAKTRAAVETRAAKLDE
jgi:serine/threonine protein kinase